MIAVTYHIHLDEVALLAALGGDPNSAVSLPYIPGSAIRGMVIGRFIQAQREGFEMDAAGPYSPLFFSSRTRYLNAYPVLNGQRSLPVPATWTIPKYKEYKNERLWITDNAFRQQHASTDAEQRKPKSLSGRFAVIDHDEALVCEPRTIINVHTARARKNAGEQQVFRYEALADGQTFKGAIVCETKTDAEQVRKLLENTDRIVLGGSRTAGYGAATLSQVAVDADWQEVTGSPITSEMVMTFLSDALLCDTNGVYRPTPDTLQVCLEEMGIICEVEPVSIRTSWFGGFNRKWGLPLPQVIGIKRGSVVRLFGIDADDKEGIRWLLEDGIGERREDGFGRVALGWQQFPSLAYPEEEDVAPVSHEITLPPGSESATLCATIERRIEDNALRDINLHILQDKAYQIERNISRTQLSRLRTVIANELRKAEPSRHAIADFLDDIEGKAGGRQFASARIAGRSLTAWLREPTFGDAVSLNDEKNILRLIDLVLERAYIARDKAAKQEVS